MIIKIYKKDGEYNGEYIGEFNTRQNSTNKTIIEKAKKYIGEKYNCRISRLLPTGKIDFVTGKRDISYILFGENLPFRNVNIVKAE
jgi:hypothetical protein